MRAFEQQCAFDLCFSCVESFLPIRSTRAVILYRATGGNYLEIGLDGYFPNFLLLPPEQRRRHFASLVSALPLLFLFCVSCFFFPFSLPFFLSLSVSVSFSTFLLIAFEARRPRVPFALWRVLA